jgi:NADH-quinone oxidoreductase subunit H
MRFGFFFFAEYVNVFILSALTVVLFFGGWNSPINAQEVLNFLHIGSLTPNIDVSSIGIWLLWILAFGVPILLLLIALPLWMLKSGWSFIKAFIVAFLIFNVLAVGAFLVWAFLSFEVVVGLFWFIVKTFTFVFIFVWMRGTLPRVRIDQLMGFAWKWLVEIALLNVFVTAGAILLVQELAR